MLVPAVLAAAGCASNYRFKIDAVRGMHAAKEAQSFQIVNGNPEVEIGSATLAQITDHVRTALSSKGLFEAPHGVAPEMTVEVDFGVDPVGRTVQVPGWETEDGYEYRQRTVMVHDKFLRITAREPAGAEDPGAGREIWSVYVTNADEGTDPEAYALLLVAAAMDAVGAHTVGEHEVVISRSDSRLTFVARGM